MKKLITGLTLGIALLAPTIANADYDYTVKSGDSLWKIANNEGVSLTKLRQANNKYDNLIHIGDKLTIPSTSTTTTSTSSTVSVAEKHLLAQLIQAEAGGEIYAGKVAVGTVVLNRVDNAGFPNTITEVINQKGQFTPVSSGSINNTPSADSIKAVEDAIAFRGKGNGSLFFYNPAKAKSTFLESKTIVTVIGNHTFLK